VANVNALVAVGVNAEGYREILGIDGIDVMTAEDGPGWLTPGGQDVLKDLLPIPGGSVRVAPSRAIGAARNAPVVSRQCYGLTGSGVGSSSTVAAA
jgi:hypothetical protein